MLYYNTINEKREFLGRRPRKGGLGARTAKNIKVEKEKTNSYRFRRSEFSELQNLKNFPIPFEKKKIGRAKSKKCGKIFQFWDANFFKVCGRKRGAKNQHRGFLQKKFEF